MDDLSQLPVNTQNHLVRALDGAKQLRSSADFFLWSQGQLCVLLEHRILLGALLDENHKVVHLECLQSLPVKPDVLEALKDPDSGYLARLARHNQDQQPIAVGDGASAMRQPDGLSDGLRQEWAGFGLGWALFIGTGPIPGDGGSGCLGRLSDSSRGVVAGGDDWRGDARQAGGFAAGSSGGVGGSLPAGQGVAALFEPADEGA